jgi:NAD(P)H-nitrite reductase large subunit
MRIGIIGAGHAGFEAAGAASDAGADVVLFGKEKCLPYWRPRLTALAFGQVAPASMFIRPAEWYVTKRIDLRPDAEVSGIDGAGPAVMAGGRIERFDGLILCVGAEPVRPPSFAAAGLAVSVLWNMAHANALRSRIRAGGTMVIIGGGILGVEAALLAAGFGMHVVVVEKAERLMPAQFGVRASRLLEKRLTSKGIQVLAGRLATHFAPAGNDEAIVTLNDGSVIGPCICLVSIGAAPCLALAVAAGLKTDRGVLVDSSLQTSVPFVFAAGDVAQIGGITRCSIREAVTQGRIAGRNAVAAVRGEPRHEYVPQTLPLMFKSGDFELYTVGPPGGDEYEEHFLEGSSEDVLRALVRKHGRLCGVQMIGTRHGFDDYLGQLEN